MRQRIAELAAVAGLFVLLGLAGASDLEQIDSQQHCGWTLEEGLAVPASCQSEEELRATLASIREERSGGRFDSQQQCGWTLEEAEWVPASCQSEEELRATVASIRQERAGQRQWDSYDSPYAECAALLDAGDWDAGSCWAQWPDLEEQARKLWGPDGDPETGAEQ